MDRTGRKPCCLCSLSAQSPTRRDVAQRTSSSNSPKVIRPCRILLLRLCYELATWLTEQHTTATTSRLQIQCEIQPEYKCRRTHTLFLSSIPFFRLILALLSFSQPWEMWGRLRVGRSPSSLLRTASTSLTLTETGPLFRGADRWTVTGGVEFYSVGMVGRGEKLQRL